MMFISNIKQKGFGEVNLFPVIACLGLCLMILMPGIIGIFKQGHYFFSIVIGVVGASVSAWLALKMFADYKNLLILFLMSVLWIFLGEWLIQIMKEHGFVNILDEIYLRAVLPIFIIFIHAFVLSLIKHMKQKSDEII